MSQKWAKNVRSVQGMCKSKALCVAFFKPVPPNTALTFIVICF